jgi:hypothetical protein
LADLGFIFIGVTQFSDHSRPRRASRLSLADRYVPAKSALSPGRADCGNSFILVALQRGHSRDVSPVWHAVND